MNSGIYSLYWADQDLVYIGQSSNIYVRFKDHLKKMRNGSHPNFKVLKAYEKLGEPVLRVLGYYTIGELDYQEKLWESQFDNTLNIAVPGEAGGGISYENANSKYSKFKLLRVFARLYVGDLSYTDISILECVDKALPGRIMSGVSHAWIRDTYPEKWNVAKKFAYLRKEKHPGSGRKPIDNITFEHIDSGELVTPDSLCAFARQYNLHQSALTRLIQNSNKPLTHKGWKLYNS